MDILFIHGNYPAQFRHIAPRLGNIKEHRVVFLTSREDARNDKIDGVEIRILKKQRTPNPGTHHYLIATEEAVLKGQEVVREINELYKEGFIPRIIVSHGGMGLGLFIKDILPYSLHIGYFEWFFRSETTQYVVENFDLDTQLKTSIRNLPILQELERCDIAVVPTEWQKSQFPERYRTKLKTIFDGVDTSFFHKENKTVIDGDISLKNRETGETFEIKREWKLVSYATRGMEPMRGFPEFMKLARKLLEDDKETRVVIAGSDIRAYSYDAPTHDGSWKLHMLVTLGEFEGKNRMIFTGLLTYEDYRKLLWRTDMHCYFTNPYVISWSLFEAAACGAYLCVNKNEATKNIVKDDSVTWVNLKDEEEMRKNISNAIKNRNRKRAELLGGYDLQRTLEQWEGIFNKGLKRNKH